MEVDKLGCQVTDDQNEYYRTYNAEAENEHGVNGVFPYKGYGKGYCAKGKPQGKGNFSSKGWGNSKRQQQLYTKGCANSDGKNNDSSVWSGLESKGKGKGESKGKGFQGEWYSCGEWGHSQSRRPHSRTSWNQSGSDKGTGKSNKQVAEVDAAGGTQQTDDHKSSSTNGPGGVSSRNDARVRN